MIRLAITVQVVYIANPFMITLKERAVAIGDPDHFGDALYVHNKKVR